MLNTQYKKNDDALKTHTPIQQTESGSRHLAILQSIRIRASKISSHLPGRSYQLIVGDEVDLEVSSHCSALETSTSKFCWQILGTSITFVTITKVSEGGIEMIRVKIHDDGENMSPPVGP